MFLGKLYDFQVEGAEFLLNKKKALLTFDQGLGKTVTAIASFEKLKELGKVKRCLVVGQASYLWQWERAIERFTDSDYVYRDYSHNIPYTLISYNIFRREYDEICKISWDIVITDEAQEYANNKSKTSQLLKKYNLEQDPEYRWALTGTAIRNKLENLYNIMYWVDKGFLPPWPFFEKKHIVRNGRKGPIIAYKNLSPLHDHLHHRVHRKTHKDVEGKIPQIIGPELHKLDPPSEYMKAQKELLNTLDELKTDITYEDFIRPITKSRVSKAFNSCRHLLSGEYKVDYLVNEIQKVLEENEENRVVIFSYYKDPLSLLDKKLKKIGRESVKFTGDQRPETKRKNIERFETDVRILLASNAGYRGLDLPYTNYLYHLDVPLTFEILDQRNKRLTRLSSIHKSVVINVLITDHSIEKYYFDIVLKQGELLKAVFDEKKDNVTIRSQSLRQYLDVYREKT